MTKNSETERPITEYRTNREAAQYLRVSEITLWRLRKQGLPFHRIGAKLLYDQADLQTFMANQRRNGGKNREK